MSEQQSRQYLHPKINVNQSLHAISGIDKRKCTINNMVWDSCVIANKWHQSTSLVWYDCPIYTKIIALTTLIKHSIHHDGDHQHKKDMNAQLTLQQRCHTFYKNPSRSTKKVRTHIVIQKKLDSLSLDSDLSFGGACPNHLSRHSFVQRRSSFDSS